MINRSKISSLINEYSKFYTSKIKNQIIALCAFVSVVSMNKDKVDNNYQDLINYLNNTNNIYSDEILEYLKTKKEEYTSEDIIIIYGPWERKNKNNGILNVSFAIEEKVLIERQIHEYILKSPEHEESTYEENGYLRVFEIEFAKKSSYKEEKNVVKNSDIIYTEDPPLIIIDDKVKVFKADEENYFNSISIFPYINVGALIIFLRNILNIYSLKNSHIKIRLYEELLEELNSIEYHLLALKIFPVNIIKDELKKINFIDNDIDNKDIDDEFVILFLELLGSYIKEIQEKLINNNITSYSLPYISSSNERYNSEKNMVKIRKNNGL